MALNLPWPTRSGTSRARGGAVTDEEYADRAKRLEELAHELRKKPKPSIRLYVVEQMFGLFEEIYDEAFYTVHPEMRLEDTNE